MADGPYGRLSSASNTKRGSEYGGVDNIIQPPPHDPRNKPREGLMQMYQTNPASGMVYADGSTETDDQPVPETQQIVK